MEHMSATNSKTIYSSNNRFRNASNLLLYIQYTQTRYPILSNITSATFYILISTTTKSLIACSR